MLFSCFYFCLGICIVHSQNFIAGSYYKFTLRFFSVMRGTDVLLLLCLFTHVSS